MDPVTGSIVSAGIGAVGSIIGGKGTSYKRQRSLNRQAYQHAMKAQVRLGENARRSALRAGFNPLTMLGAMGGAASIGSGGQASSDPPLISQALLQASQIAADAFQQKAALDQQADQFAQDRIDRLAERSAGFTTARLGSQGIQYVPGSGMAPSTLAPKPVQVSDPTLRFNPALTTSNLPVQDPEERARATREVITGPEGTAEQIAGEDISEVLSNLGREEAIRFGNYRDDTRQEWLDTPRRDRGSAPSLSQDARNYVWDRFRGVVSEWYPQLAPGSWAPYRSTGER